MLRASLRTKLSSPLLKFYSKRRMTFFQYILLSLLSGLLVYPVAVFSQDIPVTVSRDEQDFYEVKDAFKGVIQTRSCFGFVFFDKATLQLFTPSTGSLIFSDGAECSVANVFNPATVSPGTYQVSVISEGDGYYVLLDGSWLIKATGIDFAFGASATLVIDAAVDGIAAGTIAVGTSPPRNITNLYAQNSARETDTTTDLTVTDLNLLTDSYDSEGTAVEKPAAGSTLYPHIFFDVLADQAIPGIEFNISLNDSILCSGTNDLSPGSYWTSCEPILVPENDFILSATLDPEALIAESDKSNNYLQKTYAVESPASRVTPQPGLWNIDEESNGEPGRGFQIDTQSNTLILTFYGYEADGQPTFYLSSGTLDSAGFQGELQTFEGGTSFGEAFTDARLTGSAGPVTLTFDSAVTGTIQLPGERTKRISRFSYADVTSTINGVYEGTAGGIGPFSDDDSTFTLDLENGEFSLIRDAFFSGECRFEGVYVLAGTGVDASGEYECADFSSGTFIAEQVTVNSVGVYSARIVRSPDDSNEQIEEIHSGL